MTSRQSDATLEYLSRFKEAFNEKALLPLVIAVTFLMGANGVIITYSGAFLIESYSLTTLQLAPFLSLMAVGQLIGILVGGPLADRFNKARTCAITEALTGLVERKP